MKQKYIKYIIFSIIFFSAISIVYQVAVIDNPHFSIYDLGINLLSEFAGMIFTVFIFNEFLDYRQQIANTSKFRMLYIELGELLKNIEFPFQAALQKYPKDIQEELWSSKTINAIRDHILLSETDDCVFPAVPWYMIFSMQGDKVLHKCENIRIHYQDILEPQISEYLFYLSNHSEMLTDLKNIKVIYENDLLLNYTRPGNLGCYFACPTDNDFEVIKKISTWIEFNKTQSDMQKATMKKYRKSIMVSLVAIFIIGAVGYYVNKDYFFGTFFTAAAIMLSVLFIKSYVGKKK